VITRKKRVTGQGPTALVLCLTLFFAVGAINACCSVEGDGCCGSNSNGTITGSSSCCSEPKTLWFPRSAGDNLVLDQHRFGYQYNESCCTYGTFSASYRYQRNFKECRIAQSLGINNLSFVGSQDPTRTLTPTTVKSNALIADYFGLSQKQNLYTVAFRPRVQNHCIDFKLYVGMDEIIEGLYMQLNLPLIHTKWNLCSGCCNSGCKNDCNNDCGCSTNSTTATATTSTSLCGMGNCPTTGTLDSTPFPAGYMSNVTAGPVAPLTTVADALNGKAFGDFQGRSYGKFSGCHDATKVAGIYFDLGYNFWECPDYHLGIYLKVIAPTGTNMDHDAHVRNIFYPVIGDYHWQLGAGISGATELFNCDDDHRITAYLQGYVTHLFEREQVRAFDLKSGDSTASPMSRFMLAKEFVSADNLTYNSKLWSVIDWSTRKAKVRVDAKGEGLIEVVYSNNCGFSAGLGYEIYGRSKEEICGICAPCNSTMASKTLGLKGTAPVGSDGYLWNGTNFAKFVNANYIPYVVSATQSNATAYKAGTVDSSDIVANPNPLTGNPGSAGYVNPLIFAPANPAAVTLTEMTAALLQESATGTALINGTTGEVTGLKLAPTILTSDQLCKRSATMKSYITNKIFGHVDYIWDDSDWKPSACVGAECEFASESDRNAMNAWGIWIEGGVNF